MEMKLVAAEEASVAAAASAGANGRKMNWERTLQAFVLTTVAVI